MKLELNEALGLTLYIHGEPRPKLIEVKKDARGEVSKVVLDVEGETRVKVANALKYGYEFGWGYAFSDLIKELVRQGFEVVEAHPEVTSDEASLIVFKPKE